VIEALFPQPDVALAFCACSALLFEAQRWARSITMGGAQPRSPAVILFVQATAALGSLAMLACLGLALFTVGWQFALGLVVAAMAAGIVTSLVIGDRWIVRFLSTLAVWPAFIWFFLTFVV
jgi:hypothetical protein